MGDQFQIIRDVGAIAAEVLQCANSWEPRARLIGNVTAREMRRLASWAIAAIDAHGTLRKQRWSEGAEVDAVNEENAAEDDRLSGRRARDEHSADISAAISYIERDGRVLCVWNRRYGCWTLPGGKLEPGESKEAAQARELAEETGMGTAAAQLIYEAPSMSGRIVAAFRVDAVGEPRQAEPSSPIGWLTREELIRWSRFADFYRGMFAAMEAKDGVNG